MSSFTSNSRQIYGKLLLTMLIGMGAAMGAFYSFTLAKDMNGLLERVSQARKALPKIISEEKDIVIFFGSSMVDAGISPRHFDQIAYQNGKNVKSFNFGFAGLNPYFQDYVSRRISESFIENNQRMKLAVIEFNPFQSTKTRWNGAAPIKDSYIASLANNSEILNIAFDDPARGALLYNIKYFRNGISAENFTSLLGRKVFPNTIGDKIDEPEHLLRERRILRERLDVASKSELVQHNGSAWYYPWQGGGSIPEDRSKQVVEDTVAYAATFSSQQSMQNYRQRRIRTDDIEGLDFENILIESFINIVRNFQLIADEVEIVLLPRNHKIIRYDETAQLRLEKVIKEIEDATNEKVHNHQLIPQITYEMYRDATHLARYTGDVTYTSFLANHFSSKL